MLPFAQGQLAWPEGRVLFLRARDGAALRQFPLSQLVCEQSFRPDAELLERAGLRRRSNLFIRRRGCRGRGRLP